LAECVLSQTGTHVEPSNITWLGTPNFLEYALPGYDMDGAPRDPTFDIFWQKDGLKTGSAVFTTEGNMIGMFVAGREAGFVSYLMDAWIWFRESEHIHFS
jgi:hypothetical protein